jgi:ATP-dependent DNA helicase RecG
MGFAENKGSGIQAMRRLMKQAGLTPPTFDSDRSASRFVATFFLQHFLSDEELGWLDGVGSVSVDDKKALALVHVRETGRIDNARLRDLAGLDTLEASRCLRQLCDAGLLRMEGGGPSTFYSPGPDFPITESTRESHKESHKKTHKKSHKKSGEHRESHKESQKDRLLEDLPESIASEIRSLTDRGNQEDIRQAILLACANRKLSTRELSSLVGRERRYLLRTYVKPLIQDGDLQREFPESPRHRNQTYFVPDGGQHGDSEDGH